MNPSESRNAPSRAESASPSRAEFPQTEWSLILAASDTSSGEVSQALERLCRVYWPAIYAFLRHHGRSAHDAQDLTQGFILSLLRHRSLATADPAKGRFRSFLLGALKHFLADAWRREHTQKRVDGHIAFSLEGIDAETYLGVAAPEDTPEIAFDRQWAERLIDQGIQRLRRRYAEAGKIEEYEVLKPMLTSEADAGEYASVAVRLRISPENVAVRVHRLRHRFRESVRAEAAKTVASRADLERELHELFR